MSQNTICEIRDFEGFETKCALRDIWDGQGTSWADFETILENFKNRSFFIKNVIEIFLTFFKI